MENMMSEAPADGTAPSSTEVVSKVLSQTSGNNSFLKNAGLHKTSLKAKSRIERELQAQLDAKTAESESLQQEVESLKKKAEVTDEELETAKEDMRKELQEFKKQQEEWQKKQEANDLILQRLLSLSQVNSRIQ